MFGTKALCLCLGALVLPLSAAGAEPGTLDQISQPVLALSGVSDGWLAQAARIAATTPAQQQPPPSKPAPLPLHTIEGVGGVLVTPTAYLVNPGPKGTKVGLPTASFTYLNIGQKSIQSFAVTETFLGRFEIGYALNRFDLGTLSDAINKATASARRRAVGDKIRQDVYLHNFNFRVLLLEENSFDLPLPAVTAGVHVKYNSGIRSINRELGDLLGGIGYKRPNGIDYTLTASKTFPNLPCGRSLIASVGLRNSSAHQIGYLGFAGHCATTVEANVIYLITDWLAVAYEFRQKENPYDRVNNLIGDEDNWHTVAVGIVVNDHFTISAGWAALGNVFNSEENCAWGIQLKYEF